MRRKKSLENVCCPFYEVQVIVPLAGHAADIDVVAKAAASPKVLEQGTVFQTDSNNIYIGGKYKVTWKKVTHFSLAEDSFQVCNEDGLQVSARIGGDTRMSLAWPAFAKAIEKRWNKLERHRAEKEAIEKDMEKPQPIRQSQHPRKRSKAADFLSKNLQNMRDWDSDDDAIFNRQPPKQLFEAQKRRRAHHEQEVEAGHQHDNKNHESFMEADNSSANEDIVVDNHDKSVSEDRHPVVDNKPKTRKLKRKRRIEDESDDENFFTSPDMTTPSAQRVVTPGATFRKPVLDDDESESDIEWKEKTGSSPLQPSNKKVAHSIASFFPPRGKATAKQNEITQGKNFDTEATELQKDQEVDKNVTINDKDDLKESEDSKANIPKKKSSPLLHFFGPRRAATLAKVSEKKMDVPELQGENKPSPFTASDEIPTQIYDDDSTVCDDEANSSPKTPPSEKTPFSSLSKSSFESAQQVEDPITDFEDLSSSKKSTSNLVSPSACRLTGKKRCVLPRKGYYGSKPPTKVTTAARALELAEHQSPIRNPFVVMDLVTPSAEGADISCGQSPRSHVRQVVTSPIQPIVASPVSSPQSAKTPNWRGLRNLGNTCYINASLQMLYSIPAFVDALEPFRRDHRLVSTFCQIYQSLLSSTQEGAATARALKSAVDAMTDKFRGFQQRDAHEFLGELIDKVHEEIVDSSKCEEKKDDPHSSKPEMVPTDEFFRLNVEVCLKCKSCGYSRYEFFNHIDSSRQLHASNIHSDYRTKEEMYRYLSLDIDTGDDEIASTQEIIVAPKTTVEQCLKKFFQPEDRELKCEKCRDGNVATQTMRILSRPNALLIHLKRFKLVERPISLESIAKENENRSPGIEISFQKNRAPVELTNSLLLSDFTISKQQPLSAMSSRYTLKSIVHHIGNTADSGHYTADAFRRTNLVEKKQGNCDTPSKIDCPTWVSYDDGTTTEKNLQQVRESIQNQRSAYMLLYST